MPPTTTPPQFKVPSTASASVPGTSTTAPVAKTIKKKANPRPAGRPHRRLAQDKLDARIAELTKKIDVQKAKTTLLEDRLTVYEREAETRKNHIEIADQDQLPK